ncbi:hypothetical protein QJS66_08305 [Kocuria rhizophila]|nr:hypothetical protein QJS66_08305 [Kocuria rhizophila]
MRQPEELDDPRPGHRRDPGPAVGHREAEALTGERVKRGTVAVDGANQTVGYGSSGHAEDRHRWWTPVPAREEPAGPRDRAGRAAGPRPGRPPRRGAAGEPRHARHRGAGRRARGGRVPPQGQAAPRGRPDRVTWWSVLARPRAAVPEIVQRHAAALPWRAAGLGIRVPCGRRGNWDPSHVGCAPSTSGIRRGPWGTTPCSSWPPSARRRVARSMPW